MIHSDVQGISGHTQPFVIGDLNPSGPFVHVLDDTTLDILLTTLDTVSDFTAYLRKKEVFLRSPVKVLAAGEEELLAQYLENMNNAEEHDFTFPANLGFVALEQGLWSMFQRHQQRFAQLEANRVSYAWDRLIETFARHALAGKEHYTSGGLPHAEVILRFMAREPRVRRRMLAKALFDAMKSTLHGMRRHRVVGPSYPGDPYYIFVLFPEFEDKTYEENREARREYLGRCCGVVKHKFPDALDVIGIATESGRGSDGSNTTSEDALYLDARNWTPEYEAQAAGDSRELGILVSHTVTRGREKEYPDLPVRSQNTHPRVGRNKPCPCGGGKKYKKCHGR